MAAPFRASAATCALALALLAAAGGAQTGQSPNTGASQQPAQPPPAEPQQPVFRTGINFVRVDVIITDKNGNAVADLQPSDFEVVEDGKPQKIETFKLIKLDGGRVEAANEAPKAIRSEFDEESEAARDDVRLFAIFLDDYHVRRGSSMSVRTPLATFVETQLGPTDMIAVMYPLESVTSLRMTRDHAAVARGIQQFVGRKHDYTPRNQYEQQYFQYPTEIVERIRNQVSLTAIRALITHMGSLKEGRKALILVSEGFTNMLPPQMRSQNAAMPGSGNPDAYNPMAGAGDLNEDRAAWAASLDLQEDLRAVYAAANRDNVAIYAVDPRGLASSEFDISENVNLTTDRAYLTSTMDTLRTLAENTDGRAIVNSNDLTTGMKQIVRDTSAYYLIGYSSTEAPSDGKFHEIKVRVKRPGLQVRARKGYWALTAEETVRALAPVKPAAPKVITDALAPVNTPTRSRVVRTWIGTTRGENGKTKVTFVWEPMPKRPGDRNSETPARVSLMAIGPDGEPYFRGRVPASAPRETTSGASARQAPTAPPGTTGGATARQAPAASAGQAGAAGGSAASPGPRGPSTVSFEVPPGKMQLRLSVEGDAAQVLDSEVRDIAVPDLGVARTALGTPALFRARTVREFEQLKKDLEAVPLTSREFGRTDRLLIRVAAYGAAGTAPTITAKLLNRTGQAMMDLPVVAATSAGDAQIELSLAALPPGEYLVEVLAAGEGGEAKELVGFRVTG